MPHIEHIDDIRLKTNFAQALSAPFIVRRR
jgi:hypothetical protein